jgi:ribosome-binding protein aMBF1 (putative translation factor)
LAPTRFPFRRGEARQNQMPFVGALFFFIRKHKTFFSKGGDTEMVEEYKVFRFIRQYRKITLYDVAEALGVAFSTVSMIERGKMTLTKENRTKLLKFYGIDNDQLQALRVIVYHLELYLNGEVVA